MLIGIFSDTHDNLDKIREAIKLFREKRVGAVIHCGDIVAPFSAKLIDAELDVPLYVVYGNNDGEKEGLKKVFPQITEPPLLLDIEHKIIIVSHDFSQVPSEMIEQADVLVAGHTHVSEITEKDGKLWINPGDCSGWLKGRASVAILDTESLKSEIMELK